MKLSADLAFSKHWTLSSLLTILVLTVSAQNIPFGTWRTHFSYKNATKIIQTADKIFCSTENGLFSRDLETGETRKLSKIDGLSDVGVTAMAYNSEESVLVIGYASGFVDFVYEDRIRSIEDLANSNLDINKTINDIAFGPTTTYLATDFGILEVRTNDTEIRENFVQIGSNGNEVSVLQVFYENEFLIIRTTEGIQSGNLSKNLLDFNNWSRFVDSDEFLNLILVGGNYYTTSGVDILKLDTEWTDLGIDLPNGATKLFEVDESIFTVSDAGDVYQLANGEFEVVISTEYTAINDIVSIGSGYLFADGNLGLVDEAGLLLAPDGPISDDFSNFRVIDNILYGFHAPSPFSYRGIFQQDKFSIFSEGRWEERSIDGFGNVSDAVRYNNSLFYSSIGDGLYNAATEEILVNIPGSEVGLDTMITALASGESLWVSSFRNDQPVHRFSGEEWVSYSESELFDNDFLTIDLSQSGIAWLGSGSGTITVVDPIENDFDLLSTADGLPSSFIDVDISIEDNAWVATSRGPALFPDASFIFFSSEAFQPTFENRVLFEGEEINAVLTDGGNRIWFGTNDGIWIYDENTSEQVAVYNVKNSPLPSDRIIQLAYNGKNGEVFIYTDKGMVSFRSASSIGNRDHRKVSIFPNPVRPTYQGLVGLSGLARNVTVKVTDLNGNLVKEISSNGGSASWDLRDRTGGQINTGIYLFFSSSSDGEETYVGKIAVIR